MFFEKLSQLVNNNVGHSNFLKIKTNTAKKQASEKQTQRAEKMKIDPEAFREKRASEKHYEREEKMKIYPNGFREKQALEKHQDRAEKKKIYPESFRETEPTGWH